MTIRKRITFAKDIPYGKAYAGVSAHVDGLRSRLKGEVRVRRVWRAAELEGASEDILMIILAYDFSGDV